MRLIACALAPLIAATLWAMPASAGRVNCRIVTDASGDTLAAPQGTAPAPGSSVAPADPALDIVSADIAGDSQLVTAVIRVASLGSRAETAPVASAYLLSFAASERHYTLYAIRDVHAPDRFLLLDANQAANASGINVDGHFDMTRGEVHVTASYSDLAALGGRIGASTSVYDIQAYTQRAVGTAGSYTFQNADGASSPGSVRLGAASCVRPGR